MSELTLREHLEAIRKDDGSDRDAPYRNATAAIKLLEDAARVNKTGPMREFRMIHDPERDA